jgi:mono/diheme cytochrome c family protein
LISEWQKRVLRWLGFGLGGVIVLLLLATLVVYGLSARILNHTWDVPLTQINVPSGPTAVAEGARLATIRGCDGCHGPQLAGEKFLDEPMLGRIPAPNLSQLVAVYSDAELERLIRHGVRKDGRGVAIMPSSMFARLSDADVGSIIAFLRSVPRVDHELGVRVIGPMGRLGLVTRQFHLESAVIDHAAPHAATAPTGDRLAYGRYLALTSCTECHGPDLKGAGPGGGPAGPNLAMASAYSDSAFLAFFRTGNALGNRRVGFMSEVAERRFSHLTDDEVGALLAYLKTLR